MKEKERNMKYAISEDYLQRTPILDKDHVLIVDLVNALKAEHIGGDREFLQRAHQWLAQHVQPVYTLNERQPASTTLARKRGSCSQRMAVLEAVARSAGIGTRSRALWIDGQFWRYRFPQLQRFLPQRILLAWPEFFIDGSWVGFEELYGPLQALAERRSDGFTNATGETLFEAVRYTVVDWSGQTCSCVSGSACDLSHVVVADDGIFPSRDAIFDRYGL